MCEIKRIITLGSWCRVAFQCRRYAELNRLEPVQSGPFDWTITPFNALVSIFCNKFSSCSILNPIESIVNQVGSITCGYTGIAFHHDLPYSLAAKHGAKIGDPIIPHSLSQSQHWKQARSRFCYTLDKFHQVCKLEGNLFVRWLRHSSDTSLVKFPDVYAGESPELLNQIICSYCNHDNFAILYVTSQIMAGEKIIEIPIQNIKKYHNICEVSLLERRGKNGDQSNNYQGDDVSWDSCLNFAISNLNENFV